VCISFFTKTTITHSLYNLQRSDEPPGPRRGWQSPSYDEILDRKRQEESHYRREDPNHSGMRAYNSEPAIDTLVSFSV
jgi:hypothetical protein